MIMAMEIKSPPVLRGKDARYFHEVAATMTESKTKEEVQESYRKWTAFFKRNNIFGYD
jgi:hypothetical protein